MKRKKQYAQIAKARRPARAVLVQAGRPHDSTIFSWLDSHGHWREESVTEARSFHL